jgi:hypothetical protein
MVHTPSTDAAAPHSSNQYDVSLILPPNQGPPLVLEALPIIEGAFRHQGFDGLLGRDVLGQCTLVFYASPGAYTLALSLTRTPQARRASRRWACPRSIPLAAALGLGDRHDRRNVFSQTTAPGRRATSHDPHDRRAFRPADKANTRQPRLRPRRSRSLVKRAIENGPECFCPH